MRLSVIGVLPAAKVAGPSGRATGDESDVSVTVGGELMWSRRHEDGIPGGVTTQDRDILERVAALLGEALDQVQAVLLMYRTE